MKKILLGLIGLLFAVPAVADLPAGYTELQYIESDGRQYIDTGVTQTDTVGIKIVIDDTSKNSPQAGTAAYFIGTQTSGSYMGYFTRNNSAGWAAVWAWNGENILGYNIQSTYSTVYINYKNDRRYVYNNGTRDYIGVSSLPTLASGGNSLYLFAIHMRTNVPAYYGAGNIYSVELTEGTEVVRNLIPAKNSSGVVGMYDTVNNEFYTNQGTGTFTAGPEVQIKIATTTYNSARFSPVVTELNDTIATIRSVVTNTINQTKAIADLQATKQTRPDETCPAGKKCLLVEDDAGQPHWYEIIENAYGLPNGYTALEYLQSTGTQYIDTGITITSGNFQIDADMQFTSTASPQYFGIFGGGYFGITDNYFAAGGRTISKSADTQRHKFIFSSIIGTNVLLNLSIDGTNYNLSRDVSAGRVNLLVVDNSGTLMGATKAKLYSAQIYSNGTLVRDMIPAKNASGVIGMYDVVSGRFFTNAGTGTFTAGPEI